MTHYTFKCCDDGSRLTASPVVSGITLEDGTPMISCETCTCFFDRARRDEFVKRENGH